MDDELASGGGSGGDPWVPVFRDVDLVPADLAQFAELVAGDCEALRTAAQAAEDELSGSGLPNFAGGSGPAGGMPEGAEFLRAYFLTLGAELWLMSDTVRGLETLRDAATRIHSAYLTTDLGSAGTLADGFGAYDRSAVERAFQEPAPAPEGASDG